MNKINIATMGENLTKITNIEVDPNQEYNCTPYEPYIKCKGFTRLMIMVLHTIQYDDLHSIIENYIKNNKDELNKKNELGWTPLMLACRNYNIKTTFKCIKLLIELGADVNKKHKFGWTALMICCRYSNVLKLHSVIDLLLENGADVNYQKKKDIYVGNSALMLSCIKSRKESDTETIRKLIRHGANVNECNNQGINVLHNTLEHYPKESSCRAIKILLENNATFDFDKVSFDKIPKKIQEIMLRYNVGPTKKHFLNYIPSNNKKEMKFYDSVIDHIINDNILKYQKKYNYKYILKNINEESAKLKFKSDSHWETFIKLTFEQKNGLSIDDLYNKIKNNYKFTDFFGINNIDQFKCKLKEFEDV